jgi:uncharacterized OsmC-like protein
MDNVATSLVSAGRSRIRAAYGLACDVLNDDRAFRVDLPAAAGGAATGPTPEQLLRASLGASFVMDVRARAARSGVSLQGFELEIASESHGDGGPALRGWTRVTFDVSVRSAAPARRVRRILAAAFASNPLLAVLRDGIERSLRVRVIPG